MDGCRHLGLRWSLLRFAFFGFLSWHVTDLVRDARLTRYLMV